MPNKAKYPIVESESRLSNAKPSDTVQCQCGAFITLFGAREHFSQRCPSELDPGRIRLLKEKNRAKVGKFRKNDQNRDRENFAQCMRRWEKDNPAPDKTIETPPVRWFADVGAEPETVEKGEEHTQSMFMGKDWGDSRDDINVDVLHAAARSLLEVPLPRSTRSTTVPVDVHALWEFKVLNKNAIFIKIHPGKSKFNV